MRCFAWSIVAFSAAFVSSSHAAHAFDLLGSADEAREAQPSWSSPLATTTALLEQRLRFDFAQQHSGNGSDTALLDNGKGIDFIVSDTNEIQFALPPYDIRTSPNPKSSLEGFGDWTFLRVKQRLLASPASEDNYVVTAWLTVQAPTGIQKLTGHSWAWGPTLGFGKGFGPFDIQATIGGIIPVSHTATLGRQIQTNVALQYHVLKFFWPEVEFNSTYFVGGQRDGLNQLFFTTGVVIGRFPVFNGLGATFGAGYQTALSPRFRASPLTPAYNHAVLFTSRLNF